MLYKEIKLPLINVFSKIPNLVFEILFYSIVGFAFIGCINLFAQQGLFILISLILSLVYVFLKQKIVINWVIIGTLAFAIVYSIPAWVYYPQLFLTTLMYSFGLVIYALLFYSFNNKRKLLIWLGSAYVIGLFISFILTLIMTYWTQGGYFGGEVANNFWTHGLISRTGISLYQMGFIGGTVTLILYKSKFRKWYTIPAFVFLIVLCIWFSLEIGNRSFLVAMAIMMYAILFIKILLSKKWVRWFVMIIILSVIFLGTLILVNLVNKGIVTIPPELMKIPAINRLFTVNPAEGRPLILQRFFMEFYKYPFGNYSLQINNGYVHNLLLDFYTFGGVFSFLIALTFFVFYVIKMIRFTSISKGVKSFDKAMILSVAFGIIGIGFSEPIYQANPNCATFLFLSFLYMNYIVSKTKKVDKSYVLEGVPEAYMIEEDMESITIEDKIDFETIKNVNSRLDVIESKNHNKAKSAIVLITFNKPKALLETFNNLLKVNYLGDSVDLIISIDNSGSDDVENAAKSLSWPYGKIKIKTFGNRQGLKQHVIQCLMFAEEYNFIFLLEDDIYCSEAMYAYGKGAAEFYDDDTTIAGISLYNFQGNWQNWALRFEPFNNGFDTYFVKLAQSWGEVLTTRQWLNFKEWLINNPTFIKDEQNVPSINKWPDSSWLKFFDRYCFLNDKYFVYPYVSLATNCNGIGVHNSKTINDFQVELQGKKIDYKFQKFNLADPETIYYDEYFNPTWIKDVVGVDYNELTIDLWCTKPKSSYRKYVLTAGYYGKNYVKSWSLSLHPIELSLINNVSGSGIYLYESTEIEDGNPRLYNLINYSCKTSDWRRIKFYSFKLFFKTYLGLIKKKICKRKKK